MEKAANLEQYDLLFGYSTQFLASTLCPKRSYHQKFELVVDDLAFIGHPVCADSDGVWRFKPEKLKGGPRGRDARGLDNSEAHQDNGSVSSASVEPPSSKSSWLHTFHLVFVLDLPDPSSSASGNVSKYFDIIYEQIAFTATAVLFQEQVLSNFVENQCEALSSLKESCISKGDSFEVFTSKALEISSIASGMKLIYEAIRSKSIAYITFNNLPMELQLPPYLETLLHSEGDYDADFIYEFDDDDIRTWGQDLSFGWRLPVLAPWKSLLVTDGDNDIDPNITLRGPQLSAEDRTLAEELVRFLETASITLSLADMAGLLNWELESQIYPVVRWLVQHRRAKIVDTVHAGLKTVFSLPPIFQPSLVTLTAEFEKQFTHPSIPPLPRILADISNSMSRQTENHFFASVVKSKDLIPMYHDVVRWMLKRDMLVTLHLRIRVVATVDLMKRVQMNRHSSGLSSKGSQGSGVQQDLHYLGEVEQSAGVQSGVPWLSLSPKSARKHLRRIPSNGSRESEMSELVIKEDDEQFLGEENEYKVATYELATEEDSGSETPDEHIVSSIIDDPGRATPLERRWLSAMSDGKEPHIAKRFEQINQYFDGKKSDDEILYLAGISRKQLRELLHHYEEYLQTFLHPS